MTDEEMAEKYRKSLKQEDMFIQQEREEKRFKQMSLFS